MAGVASILAQRLPMASKSDIQLANKAVKLLRATASQSITIWKQDICNCTLLSVSDAGGVAGKEDSAQLVSTAGPHGSDRGSGHQGGRGGPGHPLGVEVREEPTGGQQHVGRGGYGGGRGRRNRFFATGTPFAGGDYSNYRYGSPYRQADFSADTELMMLREQAEFMQREFQGINERIKELESMAGTKKENI